MSWGLLHHCLGKQSVRSPIVKYFLKSWDLRSLNQKIWRKMHSVGVCVLVDFRIWPTLRHSYFDPVSLGRLKLSCFCGYILGFSFSVSFTLYRTGPLSLFFFFFGEFTEDSRDLVHKTICVIKATDKCCYLQLIWNVECVCVYGQLCWVVVLLITSFKQNWEPLGYSEDI